MTKRAGASTVRIYYHGIISYFQYLVVVADRMISRSMRGEIWMNSARPPPKLADRGGNITNHQERAFEMKTLDELNECQSLIGAKW